MGRGAPDAGYGRDRPLADAGFSRERPPPDAEYSRDRPRGDIRDRLGPEPGYGRELRMPPAEAAYGSERHPREPLSNGLSARMQDRLSGMRPSSRMSEPSTSYPSNGHYREVGLGGRAIGLPFVHQTAVQIRAAASVRGAYHQQQAASC